MRGGGGGVGEWGYALPPLALKLYFARDVFLEISFCVILQGIKNSFGTGTSRISPKSPSNPYPCHWYLFTIEKIILQRSRYVFLGYCPRTSCWKGYSQKVSLLKRIMEIKEILHFLLISWKWVPKKIFWKLSIHKYHIISEIWYSSENFKFLSRRYQVSVYPCKQFCKNWKNTAAAKILFS